MGTTTSYGLPYPEGTAPPDAAGDLRALAEAIDAGPASGATMYKTTTGGTTPNSGWVLISETTGEAWGSVSYASGTITVAKGGLYRVSVFARLRVPSQSAGRGIGVAARTASNTGWLEAYSRSEAQGSSYTVGASNVIRLPAGATVRLAVFLGGTESVDIFGGPDMNGVSVQQVAP